MFWRRLTMSLLAAMLASASAVAAGETDDLAVAGHATMDAPPSEVSAPAETAVAQAAAALVDAATAVAHTFQGMVSYYGREFAGRKTASGERFNPGALTMAHKSLPFGTRVKVTNVKNNRSVVVRVNDRGPSQPDRIGDVSQAAAAKLRMTRSGVIEAKLEVVGAAPARKGKKKA